VEFGTSQICRKLVDLEDCDAVKLPQSETSSEKPPANATSKHSRKIYDWNQLEISPLLPRVLANKSKVLLRHHDNTLN
jgi:hypothetical protein